MNSQPWKDWRGNAQAGKAALRQLALAAMAAVALGSMLATDRPAEASSLAALTPLAGAEATYDMMPPSVATGAPPLVMLVMSRDEQLYNKAYTDYTDITGDGRVDTTYVDSNDYIGYFDPHLCYSYNGTFDGSNSNSSSNYFSAAGNASVASNTSNPAHQCGGSYWSGNFLNWVSMSRLDLLRFSFYGGYRSTDATDNTILERAYIPDDAHAWAKVYSGSDLTQYVPSTYVNTPSMSFCNATITSSNSITDGQPPVIRIASGSYTEWAATENVQCQWRSTYAGGTNGYAKVNVPNDTNVSQTGTKCPTGDTCTPNTINSPSCPAGATCTGPTQLNSATCPSGYSCTSASLTGQPSCPSGYTCTSVTTSNVPTCPSGDSCSSTNVTSQTCPSGFSGYCNAQNLTAQPSCPSGFTCTAHNYSGETSCPSGDTCTPTNGSSGVSCPTNDTCVMTTAYSSTGCPTGATGCSGSTTFKLPTCPSGITCTTKTAQSSGSSATCPVVSYETPGSCNCTYPGRYYDTCTDSYQQFTGYSYNWYTVQLYSYTEYDYTQDTYTEYTYTLYSYTLYSYTQYSYTQYTYQGPDKIGEFTARIKVCNASASVQESFCQTYTDNSQVDHLKPVGLLQQYGESGALRFGLITGSYSKPRTGGQLRRNIGKLANNTPGTVCASGDEIDLTTGNFCTSVTQGVIKTLNLLHQPGWNGSGYSASYSGTGGASGDCSTYGILNRDGISYGNGAIVDPGTSSSDYNCAGSGNPLAEMYAEAVRYIEGQGKSATAAYVGDDTKYLTGMPSSVTWTDPYSKANWCAKCSIIVISGTATSFDSDEIPSDLGFTVTGTSGATHSIGADPNFFAPGVSANGNQFVIGRVSALSSTTYADYCQAQTISDLSSAFGVCPEGPSLEGSYNVAGIAWKAWTTDLRPDLVSTAGTNDGKQSSYVNNIKTYAVALADSIPTYTIKLSSGNIALAPLCQANNTAPGSTSGTAVTASTAGWRSCGFLSLTVGQRLSTVSPNYVYGLPTAYDSNGNQTSGSFSVVYDDSTWGNDHDLDANGMITFCVGSACTVSTNSVNNGICWNVPSGSVCDGSGNIKSGVTVDGNTLLVRVEGLSVFAYNSMLLGFSTSGVATSTDSVTNGAHRLFVRPGCTGNNDASLLTQVATISTSGNFSGSCTWSTAQVVKLTAGGSSAANFLQPPLFYAAKYGGFASNSSCSNPLLPCQTSQWSTGINGANVPDNYFLVRNPTQLLTQLGTVFKNILNGAGSGTAAAVVSNESNGDGALYEALYLPSRSDSYGRKATWLGNIQAVFVDGEGNLREDTSTHTATLNPTDFSANPAVQVAYNTTSNSAEVHRYTCDPAQSSCTSYTVDTLDNLNAIWRARDTLASAGLSSNITSNRSNYTDTADTGRYIFTFIDKNLNGTVDSGEQVPFVASSFQNGSSNYYGILNVGDATSATTLVNYIRGQDTSTLRSRTVDYYGTGNPLTYRLGDIVDSSPVVVSTPSQAFDLLYNDQTYAVFRSTYQLRRNMIYVGADDGMLHAFNGGFYNVNSTKFQTTSLDSTVTSSAHPLGTEVWAYVPFNLLSHLIWLSSPNYNHVFYFDGSPRVIEARVFNNDGACTPASNNNAQSCHPYGWGSLLVVGMRFGGGELSLPACGSSTKAAFSAFTGLNSCASSSTTITTHSAYAILDVTNPEQPPTVLAEITGTTPLNASQLGFTTSRPNMVFFSQNNNNTVPTSDAWYLMLGNGPDSLPTASGFGNGTSSRDASIYVYKMSGSTTLSSSAPTASIDLNSSSQSTVGSGAANSFVGDAGVIDWNLDFKVDNVYVGLSSGSSLSAPSGRLVKMATGASSSTPSPAPSSWTFSTLLNPGLPILQTPLGTTDSGGNRWILDGTGRLLVAGDKVNPGEQQAVFGVVDGSTAPTYANLTDVTNGLVETDISTNNITGIGSSATSESTLEATVLGTLGWKLELNVPASGDTIDAAERVISGSLLYGGTLFTPAYTPNTSLCLGLGASRLLGVNYLTGVANPLVPALGTYVNSSKTYAYNSVSLGAGSAATPTLHINNQTTGANSNATGTVNSDMSGTNISAVGVTLPASLRSTEIDWRQTHPSTGK
ncbi:MAG: hypothetical protein P4L83_23235 [Nevskia sp.]|nr:hypothetical protein [Nevskia sp.]